MKSLKLAGIVLAFATLGLAACGEEPAPVEKADARAMEGVSISDARLVLPAVAGNPAAVYFTAKNDSDADTAIRSVSVAGAKSAALHTTADGEMVDMMLAQLPKGEELKFEPGGHHVMAMELDPTLAAGGTAEVTLHFSNGKKANFPAQIRAAGEDR
ncbi:copper chaperone PCu(A)C [Tsuneonella sp. HG222]